MANIDATIPTQSEAEHLTSMSYTPQQGRTWGTCLIGQDWYNGSLGLFLPAIYLIAGKTEGFHYSCHGHVLLLVIISVSVDVCLSVSQMQQQHKCICWCLLVVYWNLDASFAGSYWRWMARLSWPRLLAVVSCDCAKQLVHVLIQ